MNNNGVNENQNLNSNDLNNANGLIVDNYAPLPEIVESMTISIDSNAINSAASDNNQNISTNVVNNTSPATGDTIYIGGNSLDGNSYENMPSNFTVTQFDNSASTVAQSESNNAQNNFSIPTVVPDGTIPNNVAPVVNTELPSVNLESPIAGVDVPVANVEMPAVNVEASASVPNVNDSTVSTGIKVSALGELKKKQKKKAAKEAAAADLDRGKISVKALVFPFLLIVGLCCLIVYMYMSNERNLEELKYECSPINSSKNEVSLDVNSTIVKDLYGKVYTTIREDLAQPEWNDKMKIYLAYRQITDADKYESNCNMFNSKNMEPYTCSVSANFVPNAFTVDTLRHEWKMLFGEETEMPLINVKLENSCIGGYQYIADRKEYVQGYCSYQNASLFKVSKKLVEAVAIRNTIILKEEVKYFENEKMQLPDYLKSGDYYYTFKLDMNYNYVFVSKKYNIKY